MTVGVICCPPPVPAEFPRDGVVAVGFGSACLCRNGVEVINGEERMWGENGLTGEECERIASADPDAKWEIVLWGPLSGSTFERQPDGRWIKTAENEGFA